MLFQQFCCQFLLFSMCLCYFWSLSSSPWSLCPLLDALEGPASCPWSWPSLLFHFLLAVFIQYISSLSTKRVLKWLYTPATFMTCMHLVCFCCNYWCISYPTSFVIQCKFVSRHKLTHNAWKHMSLCLMPWIPRYELFLYYTSWPR